MFPFIREDIEDLRSEVAAWNRLEGIREEELVFSETDVGDYSDEQEN